MLAAGLELQNSRCTVRANTRVRQPAGSCRAEQPVRRTGGVGGPWNYYGQAPHRLGGDDWWRLLVVWLVG